MKLKKFLAQSLAAAMVLTSIPVANFYHVSAMENDILTSVNQGYQNIDLVPSGDTSNVAVTVGSAQGDFPGTNVLDNNTDSVWHTKWNYNCITPGENWINFKLTNSQTVAGVLYKTSTGGVNGQVKRAKVEVSTDNGATYTEVYQTSSSDVWSYADEQSEALFTPVENVTDVRFTGLETYGAMNGGSNNYYVQAREMRLVTIPANVEKVTATVTNQNSDDCTAKVDVLTGSGHDSVTVPSGTSVIYTATPSDSMVFSGWVNESGTVVSSSTSYRVTATRNMNLTARFTQKDSVNTSIGVSASNASANSYYNTSGTTGDGPASWAFDDKDETHWHTNWANPPYTNDNKQGQASATKPLYIQMKFTDDKNAVVSKNVQKITYKPRTDKDNNYQGVGKDYQVLVANKTSGEVADTDFVVAASGTLKEIRGEQEIVLPYPVEATHIRLQFTSSYDSGWVTASKIAFYEGLQESTKQIKDVSGLVQSADADMGTATSTRTKTIQDYVVDTQLTATPAANCKFVKWIVTDQNKQVVSEIEEQNPTVQMDGNHTYTAMFAKVNEVSITLSDTYVSMNKDDTKQLTATVEGTTGEADIDKTVVWESSDPEVVSVNRTTGEITALQVTNEDGEVTITATPDADKTKSATCTVVVNEAPSTTTLEALLTEALDMSLLSESYTDASRKALATVAARIKKSMPNTTETIAQAETDIREAMKNLVQLYKITVPSENVTIQAANGEASGEQNGQQWVYVPLFEDVTVTINDSVNTAEQQFAGWVYKGKTVCTNTSYKFFVIGDMDLTYTTGERKQEEVNLFCNSKYNTSIGKLSFIGKRMVPTMYKVIEHGIVITDATGWGKYEGNPNAFVKKASRTRTSTAKGKANNGTYEAKLACGKNEQWYGRSYVTYTDGYTTYTMYSEISEYSPSNSFE